jgi:hypothetical protein
METYYCLQCFHRHDRPFSGPITCSKCGHDFLYWATSPYKTKSNWEHLPIEIKQQIKTSLNWSEEDYE